MMTWKEWLITKPWIGEGLSCDLRPVNWGKVVIIEVAICSNYESKWKIKLSYESLFKFICHTQRFWRLWYYDVRSKQNLMVTI